MVEISFLGTGGSVATRERDNTSFLLNINGSSSREKGYQKKGGLKINEKKDTSQGLILVDCPGSIVQKVKKLNFRPQHIDSILITHIHPDHIYGLPSLIHSLMLDEGLIRLFGSEETVQFCQKFLDLFGLREDKIKTRVEFVSIKPGENFSLADAAEVKAIKVSHHSSSLAYHFKFGEKAEAKEAADSGDTPLERIQNQKNLIYSGDTPADLKLFETARNADYLIHDSSSPWRFFEKYPILYSMHTHSLELGRLAQEAQVKWLIPCHFFGEIEFSLSEIEDEIRQNYKGNLLIPKDLMKFKL